MSLIVFNVLGIEEAVLLMVKWNVNNHKSELNGIPIEGQRGGNCCEVG